MIFCYGTLQCYNIRKEEFLQKKKDGRIYFIISTSDTMDIYYLQKKNVCSFFLNLN